MNRSLSILFVIIILFIPTKGIERNFMKKIDNFDFLNEKQKIRILKDVIERGPFYKKSADLKYRPETIGKFFNEKIYKNLIGNDILGFIFDKGFHLNDKNLRISAVKFFNGTTKYKAGFMTGLMSIFKRFKIIVKKDAGCELGVAVLDINEKGSEKSLPGITVEYYLKNLKTGKYLFHRFGTGSRKGIKYLFAEIAIIIVNSIVSS